MSELQLNAAQNYKEFYGRNTEQMPKLIAEGRLPLSISGFMKRRLDALNSSDEVRSSYWDNYFDSGDGIAYHPDGRAKIVLDAQPLRDLTPSSKLRNGALVLPDGVYDGLEGIELSEVDLERYAVGEQLKKKNVKDNPIWQTLARDGKLLEDYVQNVFSQGKERFGYDLAMAVYRSSASDVPTMRSWCLSRLDGRAIAFGSGHLDGDFGRLVGVAPEAQQSVAQKISRPTLNQVLSVARKYTPKINQEALKGELGKLYK